MSLNDEIRDIARDAVREMVRPEMPEIGSLWRCDKVGSIWRVVFIDVGDEWPVRLINVKTGDDGSVEADMRGHTLMAHLGATMAEVKAWREYACAAIPAFCSSEEVRPGVTVRWMSEDQDAHVALFADRMLAAEKARFGGKKP